ncbi:SUKH-4 family immunity protein [Streptacidiphilus carbonis]|uniref:SUKH-4 family immunity protein n=1 Tax=Streptacidiphilus carbonis TaxID=105422 RepID=UPI0005A66BE9|nr:SUKH-4 family immunity protein [Streptacidiphilus carbonis]
MLVTVDWDAIAADLPPGSLLRVRPETAAQLWSDPADIRLAATIGIPYADGLFRILDGLAAPDSAAPSTAIVSDGGATPPPGGPLARLGSLYGGRLFVSRADGTVHVSHPDSENRFELINGDLSSRYLLYLVDGERPPPEEDPDPYDWVDAEAIVREKITRRDPVPFAGPGSFWGGYMESYAIY